MALACAQGEDPDYMWAVIVLGYWARLFAGIIAALLSVSWLLHIISCAAARCLLVRQAFEGWRCPGDGIWPVL